MLTLSLTLMVLLPLLGALLTPFLRTRAAQSFLLVLTLALTLGAALVFARSGTGMAEWAFPGTGLTLRFGADGVSRLFAVLFAALFLLSGVFSLEYLDHDRAPERYNIFFLLTLSAMLSLSAAQSLTAFYMCYEAMTILSLPLVLHEGTKAAQKAGMKYLGYSLFGASLALFGFFLLGTFGDGAADGTVFLWGGNAAFRTTPVLLWGSFCLLLGFGGKAGLMPLHDWLPTAHPVAPAPASAVLSATITKAGVLGILRLLYYVLPRNALQGTWVQKSMVILALCTVFTGSMLAYKEKLMKRRFAWSTVSQVSYVLFGLFLLTPAGLSAALMQVVFHAVCKTALFLTAGAIIHHSGYTRVTELKGIGRRMPLLMVSYTLASLSLIGIPPFAGFVSKWALATEAITALPGLGMAGAAVLLLSAILTAGYLMSITIDAFFYPPVDRTPLRPTWRMLLPVGVLSLALLALGLFPALAGVPTLG